MNFNFTISQKELWLIIKALGRIGGEQSKLLIDKLVESYTDQRLALTNKPSPEN